MANMETRINQFLLTNEIDDSVKDSLIDLVNGCFADYVSHMSSEWMSAAAPATKKATAKTAVKKADKTEDPSECESEQELNLRCTTAVLDEYCRTHKLRVGGEGGKANRVARVWRHMQGTTIDDDFSPRSKAKKTPAKKEQHRCVCLTAKKAPCGSAATNLKEDHWFCYKHIDVADEWLAALCEIEEPKEETGMVTPKPSPKGVKKTVSKKPSANIKKKVVEPEEELESDEE